MFDSPWTPAEEPPLSPVFMETWGTPAQATAPLADDDWAWPGRPTTSLPFEADGCARELSHAVDALLAQDLALLPGPVALDRTRTLLREHDRLGLALGEALLDVQARELFALEAAGSTSGWLRQQPSGDGGRVAKAGRLAARPHVRTAVATGALGLAAADVVCRALDQLPSTTEPGQVEGVLENAVPELLSRWVAGDSGDAVAEARQALVADVITSGVAATTLAPADRLEPAFVLVGQALTPGVLHDQLQQLVDAVQPVRVEQDEEQTYHDRNLRLRQKRGGQGWRLTGDLTNEVGAGLNAELTARAQARKQAESRLRKAAEDDDEGAEFGTVGPGGPSVSSSAPSLVDQWTRVLDGPTRITDEQLAHDLLGELLDDLADDSTGLRPAGSPRPAQLTISAGLGAAEGRLGALPGTMLLPDGPTSISLAALRRAGCDGVLAGLLLDAARNPIGASGTHRHATERERRAMRAKWGDYCAGNGCGRTDTVPHHVDPWWKSGRTAVEDLIPLCKGNHHDVHDGHRVLLLRDGRMIDENGWVDPATLGPPSAGPPDPEPGEPPGDG